MRRVLVCGDRRWIDDGYLVNILDMMHLQERFSVVIEGCANGADIMAGDHRPSPGYGPGWARVRGVEGAHYPAEWDRYGRAAGPVRNRQMRVDGKPDLVIAFHHDIMSSRGTRDMVRQSRKARIPVVLFTGVGQGIMDPDV